MTRKNKRKQQVAQENVAESPTTSPTPTPLSPIVEASPSTEQIPPLEPSASSSIITVNTKPLDAEIVDEEEEEVVEICVKEPPVQPQSQLSLFQRIRRWFFA